MIKTALAKLLTLKVATATATFTVMGGVALAAGTGTLPSDLDGKSSKADAAASNSQADGAGGRPDPKPTPSEKKSKDNTPKGTPSPSMVGLCKAYAAHDEGQRGKALESPAFRALITTAGTKADVTAFCTKLLAAKDAEADKADTPDTPDAADKAKDKARPERRDGKPTPTSTPAPRLTAS
jgi:hypothetical protein